MVWSWSGHWNDQHPSWPLEWSRKKLPPPSPPAEAIKIPSAMIECEADQCAPGREGGCLWVFHGQEGRSALPQWRCVPHRCVEVRHGWHRHAPHRIARRAYRLGLTALYTGNLHGNRITGIGTWSFPGHWNNHNPSGRWFATIPDTEAMPISLQFRRRSFRLKCMPMAASHFAPLRQARWKYLFSWRAARQAIMQKDDLGIWSLTTEPLQPDYYGYIFQDTGVPVIDPSNPLILPNLLQTENMVHVPGPSSLPWEINDGPHGTVIIISFNRK